MSKPKRVSLKGKGASIFFGEYTPASPTTIATQETEQQTAPLSQQVTSSTTASQPDETTKRRGDDETKRRQDEATISRPDEATKRRIKRESMNFYEDQLIALNDFKAMERLEGRRVEISQMVRDAIDEYMVRKKLKK